MACLLTEAGCGSLRYVYVGQNIRKRRKEKRRGYCGYVPQKSHFSQLLQFWDKELNNKKFSSLLLLLILFFFLFWRDPQCNLEMQVFPPWLFDIKRIDHITNSPIFTRKYWFPKETQWQLLWSESFVCQNVFMYIFVRKNIVFHDVCGSVTRSNLKYIYTTCFLFKLRLTFSFVDTIYVNLPLPAFHWFILSCMKGWIQ